MPCALGADLSQGDDFCAFTFMFPLPGGNFGIKTRCYISSLTLMKLPGAMRQKYDQFITEGSLMVLECTVLDMKSNSILSSRRRVTQVVLVWVGRVSIPEGIPSVF